MIGRDLEQLREMRDRAREAGRHLQRKPFQHDRIALSIGEALKAASQLEGWLEDALFIVEAELYHGPLIKE